MAFFDWFGDRNRGGKRRLVEAVARPWTERRIHATGDSIIVAASPSQGWQLYKGVMALERTLMLQVGVPDLQFDPRRIDPKMLVLLLTDNNKYATGSTRLQESRGNLSLVQGFVCDPKRYAALEMTAIADRLAKQLKDLVTRLYALNYVSYGPIPDGATGS